VAQDEPDLNLEDLLDPIPLRDDPYSGTYASIVRDTEPTLRRWAEVPYTAGSISLDMLRRTAEQLRNAEARNYQVVHHHQAAQMNMAMEQQRLQMQEQYLYSTLDWEAIDRHNRMRRNWVGIKRHRDL
jgi:hypothetical protein